MYFNHNIYHMIKYCHIAYLYYKVINKLFVAIQVNFMLLFLVNLSAG